MKYQSIEGHRLGWPVRLIREALHVSPGGYDRWRRRPPGPREERRTTPAAEIRAIHGEVKARHASPRAHAGLVARGHACCVNTVAKLMSRQGVAARARRQSRRTTDSNHGRPVADDVVGRRFEPEAPDRTRAADIAYIPTREGWLYLAAVEGLHPRRIVGWSMSERIDSRPVVAALEMAISRRPPGAGLVAHPGRGSRYAGEHYQGLVANRGITRGMSRRANCWGNAPMGSFLASLGVGLVHEADFATRAEARAELFEYIEVFHDRTRRHSTLGYLSPDEFERAA